MPERQSVAN